MTTRRKAKPVEPKRLTSRQRHKVIVEHLQLVERIGSKLVSRLPAQITADELRSAGYVGLCEASRAFDLNRNVQFGAFARQRILGSMLDFLRSLDMRTRRDRVLCKTGELVFFEVQLHAGNPHLEDEIENLAQSVDTGADFALMATRERQRIEGYVARLLPRERYVVVHVFWHDRTQAQIAEDLGVGASRVSQLQKSAVDKLRLWMTQ